MRYLALDVGTKTIGIAMSDRSNTIASPFKVIRFKKPEDTVEEILNLVTEYQISAIIIGLPKNMDNSLGFAAERSIKYKELLESETSVDIYFIDERLTTTEAEKILINNEYRRAERKKEIDAVAAVLILETFMRSKEDENGRR